MPAAGGALRQQRNGLGEFALLELRLRLPQDRLRHVGGRGEHLDKLGEFRLRAVPLFVLKRGGRHRQGALLAPAGGKKLPAAQNEREQNQKPSPQKCHAPNLNDAAQ